MAFICAFVQAMTGSGGWPTSIFMTWDGKPFYAGTYFPQPQFLRLLQVIVDKWQNDRAALLHSSERITQAIQQDEREAPEAYAQLLARALSLFRQRFDPQWGGFGQAPKFPSAHNLMFLLYTEPKLAEKTLQQMYRGGIFDHIGGGFCRYSTDRQWLVPHFEKMLYDNAMLAMAYLLAFECTGEPLYKQVCQRIFFLFAAGNAG